MWVVIDYDTNEELYPASYEMREKWEARGDGCKFLKVFMAGFNRRVIVQQRQG